MRLAGFPILHPHLWLSVHTSDYLWRATSVLIYGSCLNSQPVAGNWPRYTIASLFCASSSAYLIADWTIVNLLYVTMYRWR